MSKHSLTPSELQFLRKALNSNYVNASIRLREGEYQFELAKTIAAFHLELSFPDVKDIIRRLYGEDRTDDVQFVRKIQTILKKMEKSNIVGILPKKEPWELQRYALSSFKFQDSDKNLVTFVADEKIKETQDLLRSIPNQQETFVARENSIKMTIVILVFIVIASYLAIVWTVMQPILNPVIFVSAFSVSIVCALLLGKILSQ